MSHAPETSLSSRELTERLRELKTICAIPPGIFEPGKTFTVTAYSAGSEMPLLTEHQIEKLLPVIDAWVRVREAIARLQAAQKYGNCCCDVKEGYSCFLHKITIPELESALTAARKQLVEKT